MSTTGHRGWKSADPPAEKLEEADVARSPSACSDGREFRPACTFYARRGKRLFDLLASVAGLLVLSPILLVCAAAIRLASPGPVLFRQLRMGRDGKLFRIYKFRTMIQGAESQGGHITSSRDRRITRVGRFLRYWKLDELPQLVNIARGEMSLVGPRPQVLDKVRLLTEQQQKILALSPGITGLSAVCDRREEERLAEVDEQDNYYMEKMLPRKVQQELYYATNVSFKLDLRLILVTLLLLYFPGTSDRKVIRVLGREFELFSPVMKMSLDLVIYAGALVLAYLARYEGPPPNLFHQAQLGIFLVGVPPLRVLVNRLAGVYTLLWRYISLADAFRVVSALALVSALLAALRLSLDSTHGPSALFMMPLSIITGEFLLSSFGCLGARALRCAVYELDVASRVPARPTPKALLLVCAGSHGASVARSIRVHPELEAVGFVDDDPMKQHKRVSGVPVLSTIENIPQVAQRRRVDEVVLCADRPDPDLVQRVGMICGAVSLPFRIVPDASVLLMETADSTEPTNVATQKD